MYRIRNFFALRRLRREKAKIDFNEIIWSKEKGYLQRQNQIDADKKKIITDKHNIKLPSWGKMLLAFLFVNFTLLEGFIVWVTIKSFELAMINGIEPSYSPLLALIPAVLGETISYGIYCAKSKAENTKNGIVYETAMRELRQGEEEAVG